MNGGGHDVVRGAQNCVISVRENSILELKSQIKHRLFLKYLYFLVSFHKQKYAIYKWESKWCVGPGKIAIQM